jgi:hypothetical protein
MEERVSLSALVPNLLARKLQRVVRQGRTTRRNREDDPVTDQLAVPSRAFRGSAFALLAALAGLVVLDTPSPASATAAQAEDRASWVLFSRGSSNVMMSGSTDDMQRARALRSGQEPLLFVRQGGAAYVIRDAATLRRAEAIFAPQREMGERQAALGARQAALGAQQARLGSEQARLGSLQANASERRAGALSRRQADLGRRQGALGAQQNTLGREQSALGREQDRLARAAEASLRSLVAEAVRSGAAQRVD